MDKDRVENPVQEDVPDRQESDAETEAPSESFEAIETTSPIASASQSIQKLALNQFGKDKAEELGVLTADFCRIAESNKLSPDKIVKALGQVERLLNADKLKIPAEHKYLLAQSLLNNMTDYHHINQGQHGTCMSEGYGKRPFAKHPDLATEIVVSAAIDGKWTAPDKKVISLQPDSLKPNDEEIHARKNEDGRNYASQLFDLVVINDATQRRNPPEMYIQSRPNLPQFSGERLMNMRTGQISNDAEGILTGTEVVKFNTRLLGHDEKFALFTNYSHKKEVAGYTIIDDISQLDSILTNAKQNSDLPMFVLTLSNDRDLAQLNKEPIPKGEAINHGIAITDYDPVSKKVFVSDNRGSEGQKWIPLSEMYQVMDYRDSDTRDKGSEVQAAAIEKFGTEKSKELGGLITKFIEYSETRKLSKDEIINTLSQIQKLIGADEAKVSLDNRYLLAKTTLENCFDLSHISQGAHDACMSAAYSKRLYARHPAAAAEMVTTAALEGYWKAPDNKVIILEQNSLHPFKEEQNADRTKNERVYASQLLELIIVNDTTQRHDPPRFMILQEEDQSKKIPGATLVELADFAAYDPRKPGQIGFLSTSNLLDFEERLTGKREPFVIYNVWKQNLENSEYIKVDNTKELEIGYHGIAIIDYDLQSRRAFVSDNRGKAGQKWVTVDHLLKLLDPWK